MECGEFSRFIDIRIIPIDATDVINVMFQPIASSGFKTSMMELVNSFIAFVNSPKSTSSVSDDAFSLDEFNSRVT